MGKFILFCADGTWNGPGQDDDGDGMPDATNVYKLFCGLEGNPTAGSLTQADEQEKELTAGGKLIQVAKYIHGVGDSRNPIRRLLGGAFGAGMIARIVRGYTFISRNYAPGDAIVIVGFSRGAYTARALAGMIAATGLLAPHMITDHEQAYRAGAHAWYRYREQARSCQGILQHLAGALADLPAFVSHHTLQPADLVAVDALAAVAVWDTVGALGLPHYIREPGVDAFQFADTKLSEKVTRGFHAISLDEQRVDFIPCLWDAAPNVEQMLFAGAHADVGGGYTTGNKESGLSDLALDWMAHHIHGLGVRLISPIYPQYHPDPLGTAHKPWLKWPFNDPGRIRRRVLPAGLPQHPSIASRTGKPVKQDPTEPASIYPPQ